MTPLHSDAPDPMSRAEGGNQTKEKHVTTQFIDTLEGPLTEQDAQRLTQQLANVKTEADRERQERANLVAELASTDQVIGMWDEIADVIRRRLSAVLSPLAAEDAAPPTQAPQETKACEAAQQTQAEQPQGRDPYGQRVTGTLPQANGHVHTPGSFDPSTLPPADEDFRVSRQGWTGPVAKEASK